MTCPDCKSDNAVSKAEAWDALVEIPPKAKEDLAKLTMLEATIKDIHQWRSLMAASDETVTLKIPKIYYDRLLTALGMEPSPLY